MDVVLWAAVGLFVVVVVTLVLRKRGKGVASSRSSGASPMASRVHELIESLRRPHDDYDRRITNALVALGALAVDPVIQSLSAGPSENADPNDKLNFYWRHEKVLEEIGEPALLPLISALEHGSARVRVAAVKALRGIQDPRVIEPLISAVRDASPEVREKAVWALRSCDSRAVELLIAACGDESPDVRDAAVWQIKHFDDPRLLPLLIDSLEDNHWTVRKAALTELVRRSACSVQQLVHALKDRYCVKEAAQALGEIGDSDAVEPLVAALHPEAEDTRYVADALGRIGDSRAVAPLIDVIRKSHTSGPIHSAAQALAQIKDASAVEPLLSMLKDTALARFSSRRQAIAAALGEMGDIRAVEALKESAENDPEERVREEATQALTKLRCYTEEDASIETVRLPPFERVTARHADEAVEILFTQALVAIPVVTPKYIRGFCVEVLHVNPDDSRRLVNGPANRLKDLVKLNLERVPKHLHPGQQILHYDVNVPSGGQRCCMLSIVVGDTSGSPGYMFGVRLWRTKDEAYAYGWDPWISQEL